MKYTLLKKNAKIIRSIYTNNSYKKKNSILIPSKNKNKTLYFNETKNSTQFTDT